MNQLLEDIFDNIQITKLEEQNKDVEDVEEVEFFKQEKIVDYTEQEEKQEEVDDKVINNKIDNNIDQVFQNIEKKEEKKEEKVLIQSIPKKQEISDIRLDLNNMNNTKFLYCDICQNTFDDIERIPKVLTCGHTFW